MKTSDYIGIGILGLGAYALYKFSSTSTGRQIGEGIFTPAYTPEQVIANPSVIPNYAGIPSKELRGNSLLLRDVQDGKLTTYKVPYSDLSEKEKSSIAGNRYGISNDTLKYTYTTAGQTVSKAVAAVAPTLKTVGTSALKYANPATVAVNSLASSYNKATQITTKTVQTPTSNVTYKGTAAQIAVGQAVDNAKSLISSITSKISSTASKALKK